MPFNVIGIALHSTLTRICWATDRKVKDLMWWKRCKLLSLWCIWTDSRDSIQWNLCFVLRPLFGLNDFGRKWQVVAKYRFILRENSNGTINSDHKWQVVVNLNGCKTQIPLHLVFNLLSQQNYSDRWGLNDHYMVYCTALYVLYNPIYTWYLKFDSLRIHGVPGGVTAVNALQNLKLSSTAVQALIPGEGEWLQ